MQASTVVTRTPAGTAELAAPAHGLSLTQRRFLTLLDSACSLDALLARQPADAEKLQRDLARLASLGLVAFDAPAANDEHLALDAVRLGPPGGSSRLRYVAVALAVLALGLAAWRFLAPSPAPVPSPQPSPPATQPEGQDAAPEVPDAIATRVLVSEPAPARPREAPKESPKAKPADGPSRPAPGAAARSALPLPALQPLETGVAPQPFVAAPIALPIEKRSPSPAAAAAPVDAVPARADAPAAPPPVHAAPSATEASLPPVQVAAAAPVAAALVPAPAPPRTLVPLVREPPAFPREAMAAGLASGSVKARVVVDAKGNVSSVEIVSTSHRAFDRAVRDALARWRFEPGVAGRTTTVDVAFRRDSD